MFSGGIERDQWHKMGIWIKTMKTDYLNSFDFHFCVKT